MTRGGWHLEGQGRCRESGFTGVVGQREPGVGEEGKEEDCTLSF